MLLRKRRPRLLLVNPRRKYRFHWDLEDVARTTGKRIASHPLALPLVAALTPRHWDVRIIDEEMQPLRIWRRPDLVGITSILSNVRRAYELADHFRMRGIPVVLGGPQVSCDTQEALRHADSVVVGEAEGVWDECLADFEAGCLKPRYQASGWCEFRNSPVPRWDLLNTGDILSFGVQVSRGCPHKCDFCIVHSLFGRKQRYRDISDVLEEIAALPGRQVSFADDNLTADRAYAREFMRRLAPFGISWSCQAAMDVAFDKELLALMAEAGCESILIGFESLDPDALREAGKRHNRIRKYGEAVENLHAHGIHPIASFVVGFESDTLDAFDHIRRFCEASNLSYVMISALAAFPGSDLYDRMMEQGRVTPVDTDLINGMYPNIRYRNMSQVDMFIKGNETLEKLYSYQSLCRKAPAVLGNGAFRVDTDVGFGALTKARTMVHLLKRHLLTRDPYKRRLFVELFKLIKENRAAPGAIVQYLMFMDSFTGFLNSSRYQNQQILRRLLDNETVEE